MEKLLMVSPEELLASVPALLAAPCPPIRVEAFDALAFEHPESEESMVIHRGRSVDFHSILHFWVKSLQSLDWQGQEAYLLPYLQGGRCQSMTEAEFNECVARFAAGLKSPSSLPLHSPNGFVRAMQMYDEWYDVGAVAEYADEYLAFYWETTA
jgi:hypothetical protein